MVTLVLDMQNVTVLLNSFKDYFYINLILKKFCYLNFVTLNFFHSKVKSVVTNFGTFG